MTCCGVFIVMQSAQLQAETPDPAETAAQQDGGWGTFVSTKQQRCGAM